VPTLAAVIVPPLTAATVASELDHVTVALTTVPDLFRTDAERVVVAPDVSTTGAEDESERLAGVLSGGVVGPSPPPQAAMASSASRPATARGNALGTITQ
jgi:hypothetical protein